MYYRWIFEIPFWIRDILLAWTVLVVYDATVGRLYWACSKTGKDRDSLHESLRSSVHIVLLRSPVTLKTDFAFSISSNVTQGKHFPQTQYDFTNGCTAQNSQVLLALRFMVRVLVNSHKQIRLNTKQYNQFSWQQTNFVAFIWGNGSEF